MVSSFISRIVILVFGTLYPAYASYKAVRTKNGKEYAKWMMYWIVFALFSCFETVTDIFLSFWFPFYYELKIITVIYLLSPATNGSSILYRKFVHPILIKREEEIDDYISKAKEQGYHTALKLSSKGFSYATTFLMQTAIKGGGGLMHHLKKSYSLGDLSEGNQSQGSKHEDQRDGPYGYCGPKGNERQNSPDGRDSGLYFTEINGYHNPVNHYIGYSNRPESGYSSENPLHSNVQASKGFLVNRTSSLTESSRMRTRASSRNDFSKRASLSEGGPTWATTELHESQVKTNLNNIPVIHSASFSYSFAPPTDFIDTKQTFENLNQNPLNTFSMPLQYPMPFHSSTSENVDFKNQGLENVVKTTEAAVNNTENLVNAIEVSVSVPENTVNATKISASVPENTVNATDVSASVPENTVNATDVSASDPENVVNTTNVSVNAPGNVTSTTEVLVKVEVVEDVVSSNSTDTNTFDSVQDNVGQKKEDDISDNSNKKDDNVEGFDREKSSLRRSGKYYKRPAPTPPVEGLEEKIISNSTIEDDSENDNDSFCTPEGSPKLERKRKNSYSESFSDNLSTTSNDLVKTENLEVTKSPKSKTGKSSKRIHFPKLSFSFRSQKGVPRSSVSETPSNPTKNSVSASVEQKTQSETEYYIPLKDTN